MKVKELKAQLENYKDEDEILVAYWDKSHADSYVSLAGDRDEITDAQWREVVAEMDNETAHEYDLNSISEIINAKVEKIVPIGSEGATR